MKKILSIQLFLLVLAYPAISQENVFCFETDTTNLLGAISSEKHDLANLLIERNSDVNTVDRFNSTPLMYAIWFGNTDLAKLLINKGAYVNALNDDNKTPLDYALTNNNSEVAELLIKNGANIKGTINDYQKVVVWYADIVSDFMYELSPKFKKSWTIKVSGDTITTISYKTPLTPITITERTRINDDININYLKESIEKFFFKIETAPTISPLMWALKYHEINLAKLLIEKGADVNAKDNKGKTPLMHAIGVDFVKLLIEKGADVNAKDNNGKTPLMHAIIKNFSEKAIFLIDKGANVNAKDNNGKTPLIHSMSSWYSCSDIHYLIEKGADVNASDSDGKTPLTYAIDLRDTKRFSWLIVSGADIYAKDYENRTPLMYICNSEIPAENFESRSNRYYKMIKIIFSEMDIKTRKNELENIRNCPVLQDHHKEYIVKKYKKL